ncbi:MAG: tRNA (adenosine(37)-N6)-dimethylallyltransferase MiaA [Candidatus Omnitrophica bacterium]|nr:tRNA (adenosine(37)-N6)-dimethylallyltransferase MiaA [Candidatus Omnitrophota bacterium]
MKKRIIFIVGPTGAGKSDVALLLAKKINAAIISCDSMQIYKGMDILTSKPDKLTRRRVKHYLMDEADLTREFDVSKYRKIALKAIGEAEAKGKVALFVGGTGLYVSALKNGLFETQARDEKLVKRLYSEAKKYGNMRLYKKLKQKDPGAALKIHPNDLKRIVRALEVFKSTGKPISQLQQQRTGLELDHDLEIFCLNLPRDILYERINSRVDEMFKKGLKEVKGLLKKKISRTASYAIGIKEISGYLKGEYTLEEARQRMQLNTRRYAKRQLTWFRKDPAIKWINIKGSDTPKRITQILWSELS